MYVLYNLCVISYLKLMSDYELYQKLREKLLNTFPEFSKYTTLKVNLENAQDRLSTLFESVSFDVEDNIPDCKHQFIFLNGDLDCIHCGKSTKDYEGTKEIKKFLATIARSKNILIKEVKEEDLPFINVLLKELENTQKEREQYYDSLDDESLISEYRYYAEEDNYTYIPLEIRRAHLLDEGKLSNSTTRVLDLKYFNPLEKEKMQEKLKERIEKLEKCNIENKDEFLNQCRIAKYEIMILAGYSISYLLANAKNDLDIENLTRAYYNLTNYNYREKSKYFKTENDARSYYIKTANPVINRKILELKLLDKK